MIKDSDDDLIECACDNCKEKFDMDEDENIKLEKSGFVELECPFCEKKTICEYN